MDTYNGYTKYSGDSIGKAIQQLAKITLFQNQPELIILGINNELYCKVSLVPITLMLMDNDSRIRFKVKKMDQATFCWRATNAPNRNFDGIIIKELHVKE